MTIAEIEMAVPARRAGAVAAAGICALSLAGCLLLQRPQVASELPEAEAIEPSGFPVEVTIVWNAPVDLDLYVTDPELETVYFANSPSGSGGRLERDVQCVDVRDGAVRRESVSWADPKSGRYRVGVDFIDACESGRETARFRVVVDARGRREERVGTVKLERFEPVVLEFDLNGDSGEQSHTPEEAP